MNRIKSSKIVTQKVPAIFQGYPKKLKPFKNKQ